MAKKPDPRVEQARGLFRSGKKLKEIAQELGVPEGTVRSWKNRYGWDCNVAKNNRNIVAIKGKSKKKAAEEDVGQVMGNPGLTDKQRLFCLYYVRCFNATKAAKKAGYSQETASEQGYQLLQKTSIRNEIAKLKQNRLNREMLDASDIFQKYMDIAFADITDYVEFGRETVPVMGAFGPVMDKDPETGEKVPVMQEVNVVRFRESSEIDGTLVAEVKQGKSGASIKLLDKMKALEWLADHIGIATEEQKARIEVLRAKAQATSPPEEDQESDGFIEALEGLAADDWADSVPPEADDEEENTPSI